MARITTIAASDTKARYFDRRGLVAQNCYAAAGSEQTGAQTSRTRHTIVQAATNIALVYGNFACTTTQLHVDTIGTATYTITASIEQNGTIYRVTFGGKTTGTIEPGGIIQSDPIGLNFAAGEDMYVRTFISSSTTKWYPTLVSWNSAAGGVHSTDDWTAPGSSAIANSQSFMYGPMAIYGTQSNSTLPTVAICGDSIATGQKDDPSGNGEGGGYYSGGGYIARALGLNYPWVAISSSGDRTSRFATPGNASRRMVLLKGCTHAISNYGINDTAFSSSTYATNQANLITVWSNLNKLGLKVFQTTITPYTTSTDSWATVANQTKAMTTEKESNRTNMNDWLRDRAPIINGVAAATGTTASNALRAGMAGHPLAGYFDVADLAESARNSGIWKAGYTTDGLHPSPTGYAALAAGVVTSRLVL